jgi:hypothetical protein
MEKIGKDLHKIDHIMEPKHLWEKIGVKNWDQASEVMNKVLKEGVEIPYKTVSAKELKIGDEIVCVTYKKMPNGTINISDAWVIDK